MKKISALFLTLILSISLYTSVFAKTTVVSSVPVVVNNAPIEFTLPVLNIDGSNYFPMRELLNALGVSDNNINWNQEKKQVTFYANNKIIIYTIDDFNVISNGVTTKMDTKPVIYNGSTYMPIRSVATSCGYNVSYDNATKTTKLSK